MKKTLISLALFSVIGLGNLKMNAAESGLIYGYSGDIGTNISVQAPDVLLGGAMYIPEDIAAQWNRAKISGLRIGFGYGNARNVTVFISEELGDDPIFTQDAYMEANVWNNVDFTTPVEVPADGFYIGYEITTKSKDDFPVAVDNIATKVDNAGYIGINGKWENYASQFGSLCLKVLVEGDNLPANDIYALGNPVISPYVGLDTEFPVVATVINNGAKTIESVSASCLINGINLESDIQCALSPASIQPGEFGTVTINGLVYGEKGENLKVDVTIDTVNGGEDANPSNNLISGTTTVLSEAFLRNFVVEEWTGTWCGYCPYGIVGMEYMREKYGNDRFIGIAVHGGQAGEPMMTTSYNGFMSAFGNGGYPGCVINRNRNIAVTPFKDLLEYYYLNTEGEQTFANVEITDIDVSTAEEGKISVTSKTTFSIGKDNARYRMAYVLVEDNVGPYTQTNYYSGGSQGPLEGWDNKGSKVEWLYNDVARWIENSLGVNNSLPSSLEEGVGYEYTCQLPIENVQNLGNCHIVALILNSGSGVIENAVKMKLPVESGVEGIYADDVKVMAGRGEIRILGDYKKIDVYTLSGRKVATSENTDNIPLEAGIYVYSISQTDGKIVTGKILIH